MTNTQGDWIQFHKAYRINSLGEVWSKKLGRKLKPIPKEFKNGTIVISYILFWDNKYHWRTMNSIVDEYQQIVKGYKKLLLICTECDAEVYYSKLKNHRCLRKLKNGAKANE